MADDELELEEKKSPKKLIIIIVAALVLLLGGGAAAYFLLSSDEPPADEVAETDKKGEKGEKGESDKDGDNGGDSGGEAGPVVFHEFEPMFLVNLAPGGPHKLMHISLFVMSRDQAFIDFVTGNDPMIRHHLLNLLGVQDGKAMKTREGKEKLQGDIKAKIVELAEEMSVKAKIGNVYFVKFVMQ